MAAISYDRHIEHVKKKVENVAKEPSEPLDTVNYEA
jgi:hypothetical protein